MISIVVDVDEKTSKTLIRNSEKKSGRNIDKKPLKP